VAGADAAALGVGTRGMSMTTAVVRRAFVNICITTDQVADKIDYNELAPYKIFSTDNIVRYRCT